MTEVRLCINCNNCYITKNENGMGTPECHLPSDKYSLITGEPLPNIRTCNFRRLGAEGTCGTEGKLFEPKRGG